MIGRAAWLSLFGLFAACSGTNDGEPVVNLCAEDRECAAGERCARELEQCVADTTLVPYEVVLQVSAPASASELVTNLTLPKLLITKGLDERAISIPQAVAVSGSVRTDAGIAIEAELTFAERSAQLGLPVTSIVVSTGPRRAGDEAPSFVAKLSPETTYDVSIQPIGVDSESVPPTRATFETGSADRFDFVYPTLVQLEARLIDELGEKQRPNPWVRIRGKENGEVLSSIGVVKDDGSVSLTYVEGSLMHASYELEINLQREHPWRVTVAVDPLRIDSKNANTITIPVVPEAVEFTGSVKTEDFQALPLAELTFVSEFKLPDTVGEVFDRDWCRSHVPGDTLPAYACAAEVTSSVDDKGLFTVSLLPGDYRVFVTPSRDASEAQRVATFAGEVIIETQPGGGAQGGAEFRLGRTTRYRGSVTDRRSQAVPNVLVRAVALGLIGMLGDRAAYNRSSSTVTDVDGRFELPLDTGYFDLLIQPAAGSGYPWVYLPNREFQPNTDSTVDVKGFRLPAPAVISGELKSGDTPLEGAHVDAFAVVVNLQGGKRSVQIGQSVSDAKGRYVLLLPPSMLSVEGP